MAEWISVNEAEKPEHREVVLAYVAQTKVYFVAIYDKKDDRWVHETLLYTTFPTHWKRLEPPKGE